jgi:hypothetical protein
MRQATPQLHVLVAVAGIILLGACSPDRDSALVPSPTGPASLPASQGEAMAGYEFDAPAERSWDKDSSALQAALVRSNGRLIVAFKNPTRAPALRNHGVRADLTADDFENGVASLVAAGATVTKAWPAMGAALLQVPAKAVPALFNNPFVDFADPDEPQPLGASNDEVAAAKTSSGSAPESITGVETFDGRLAASYGNAELDANWSIGMLHAPEAWTGSTGANDHVMLMAAYGMDLGHTEHPVIPASNCGGAFGSCNGSDGYGWLGNYAVGAWMARQNNVQAVGAAPGIQGANVRVWRVVSPPDTVFFFSTVIDGINQAYAAGVRTLAFIQFSWTTNDANMASAIAFAWSHNIVMVAPVYGDGTQVVYPSSYTNVIAVSGALRDRTFATHGNPMNECSVGSGWGTAKTKAAAPWTATLATTTIPSNAWLVCGGSIAAGYAAGVVSLIRSKWPTWTPTQVRDRLLSTASPAGDAAYFGSGILNANAAITLSGSISGPDNVQPFVTCEWSASGSGGNTPYTYSWTASGGSGSGQYFDYFNSVISGSSFTVVLKITDVTGSSVFVSKNVTVNSNAPACNF